MDPITAIGLVSGVFQIAQVITETVHGLSKLHGRFNNADLTIRSLIGELTTIRSAIIQLDDWAKKNARKTSEYNEYYGGLYVALDGCSAVISILSEEVSSLLQCTEDNEPVIGFRTRAKVVWKDDIMKEHQSMLHAQVLALQLLLQACQCRSSTEQIELLRRAENRILLDKVAEDTATIRTKSIYASSRADTFSQYQSSVGDTVFDFDDAVMSSMAYRQALQHARSKSEQQAPVNFDNRSRSTDEGYSSGVIATPETLSPTEVSPIQHMGSTSLPFRPLSGMSPQHGRSKSATFNSNPVQNQNNVWRWPTDSTVSSSSKISRSSESKREKVRAVFRRLSSTPSGEYKQTVKTTQSTAFTPRRDREGDTSPSIDLTSLEGASAPVIVKMAQTGTRFDVERLIEGGQDIEARHIHSRRNALLVAAHCGNEDVVNLLIMKNARLNVTDGSGCTALHLAASRGHCGILALLLLENIDLEARNSYGRTALWIAASQGQRKATRVLISNHAKVNARADNQMTALHAAAKRGDVEIVELIVSHGADLEAKDGAMMTALHYACEEGNLGVIELLLNNKANVDSPGSDRRTPLICAAATGKLLVVQHLLKRKANYRATDDSAMTALHWAAFNGHTEIVDLLCQKKNSLAVTNMVGRTPLHLAVMNGQFAVVELLLRRKVSLESRCQAGLDLLHYACMADSPDIAKLLLIHGSNIEVQAEGDQRRPIHIAASRGSMGLLNLLCDKGASLDARDAMGDRALCVACRHGHSAAVQKLLERGSPLYQRFGAALHEDSPLCLASMSGHAPVVSLLLQHGASVLRRDEMGWQPFRYAAYYGHPEVLRLLLSMGPAFVNDGPDFGLTAEKIGFAPHANISEERRKAVQDLLDQAQGISRTPTQHLSNLPLTGLTISTSPTYLPTRQGTVTSPTTHELPTTLEQGLPSSRSVTPERMHKETPDLGGGTNAAPRIRAFPAHEEFDAPLLRQPTVHRESRISLLVGDAPQSNSLETWHTPSFNPSSTPQKTFDIGHFEPYDPSPPVQSRRVPSSIIAHNMAPIEPSGTDLSFDGRPSLQALPVFSPKGDIDNSDCESIATVVTAPEESNVPDMVHELSV